MSTFHILNRLGRWAPNSSSFHIRTRFNISLSAKYQHMLTDMFSKGIVVSSMLSSNIMQVSNYKSIITTINKIVVVLPITIIIIIKLCSTFASYINM